MLDVMTVALSSLLTTTFKIAEKAYEISAVDTGARNLLQTVEHVSSQLKDARCLRRQKSDLFTTLEKRMFDQTFCHTEEAIQGVAMLAERARVDMEVSGGRLRASTRILFVIRDSPGIQSSLAKLTIAGQSLNSAIVILTSREGHLQFPSIPYANYLTVFRENNPPPNYEESEFLAAGRRRNLQRQKSWINVNELPPSCRHLEPQRLSRGRQLIELPADSVFEATRTMPFLENQIPSTSRSLDSNVGSIGSSLQNFEGAKERQTQHYQGGRTRSQRWLQDRCGHMDV